MFEYRPIFDLSSNLLHIYNDCEIVKLTYITKYAVSISHRAQYFQLDTSFKAIFPYVYSIPLGICKNDSFPLGLQLSASETTDHYSTFFTELSKLIGTPNFFEEKAFLSDMGTALKKFFKDFKIIHFYCYRHILERLGLNTFTALIIRKLLFASSIEEFAIHVEQAITDLAHLYTINQLTESQINFIKKLFNWEFAEGNFYPPYDNLNFKQALWNRSPYGVTTCSNHVERIHRTCNTATKLLKDPLCKLKKLIEIIELRFEHAFANPNKQAKSMLTYLQHKATKLDFPKRSFGQRDSCNIAHCNWSLIYSNRFQIPNFPCIHTCRNIQVVFENHIPFTEFIPEDRLVELAYNGACRFRTRKKGISASPMPSMQKEQSEHLENTATIEETSPSFNSTTAYLYELTNEIIRIHELWSMDFYNLFAKLSMDWSLYLRRKHKTEDDLEIRSEFKYRKWSEYSPKSGNSYKPVELEIVQTDVIVSEEYEEEEISEGDLSSDNEDN
jgi:hypothetical protein